MLTLDLGGGLVVSMLNIFSEHTLEVYSFSLTFLEKEGIYLNIEGKIQKNNNILKKKNKSTIRY